MFKKMLSYLIPIPIFKQKSNLSKSIEVTWNNGEMVLDSENTNYSYGSLQRILRKGLKYIGFNRVKSMNHVLVLGVAGGSVIKTLTDEIGFKGKITGVEVDGAIIKVANDYFGLDKIQNLEIVIDDAFEFVLKTKEKYDLIIIDIFQDIKMPNFLFENFFTDRLYFILNSKGYILFNTMILTTENQKRNEAYKVVVNKNKFILNAIDKIEEHNELIILEKIN